MKLYRRMDSAFRRASAWPALRLGFVSTLAIALASPAGPVSAALVFSDDFSTPNGPLLGTTADIGGTWTITGTSVVSPLMINANAVPLANTGQDGYAAFSGSVPTSAGDALQTTVDVTVTAAGAAGDYFTHLSDPAGTTTNFYQRLFARSTAGGFQIGLAETGGGGVVTAYGVPALSFGTTYTVGVNWLFVPGPTNDVFAITVNSLPYLTKTWTSTSAEPAQVSAANLRQGGGAAAPVLRVDNLSVDRVPVPEPATLALASVCGFLALACRRASAS